VNNKLIEENYTRMIRVMRAKYITSDIDIEDIDHCVHLGLVKAAQRYNAKKAKFFTYAYIRCKSEIMDLFRKTHGRRKPKKQLVQYINDITLRNYPDLRNKDLKRIEDDEEFDNIIRLAGNPEWIDMLRMYYMDGYSQLDIAKKYKVPIGTIWHRFNQAKYFIRQGLEIA